jgi:hypothetical protein
MLFFLLLTMNQANRAIFELHLMRAYADLFVNDPEYAYSAARCTPSELAYKMTLGLARNEANKDGGRLPCNLKGIKRACKLLGIKYTYKAIDEYLNAPEVVEA